MPHDEERPMTDPKTERIEKKNCRRKCAGGCGCGAGEEKAGAGGGGTPPSSTPTTVSPPSAVCNYLPQRVLDTM